MWFRDKDGIEHEAVIFASSASEAAALGLGQFGRAEWSTEEGFHESKIRVEVGESTVYSVPVFNTELWLKRNGLKDQRRNSS